MCGIAGFSLSERELDNVHPRTLTKRLALSIESRGRDATGVAHYNTEGEGPWAYYTKHAEPASDFVERHRHSFIPRDAGTAVIHTRMATQGSKHQADNNHPIIVDRWNDKPAIVGVHNGVLMNDFSVWRKNPVLNAQKKGEVDSQLIFQILSRQGVEFLDQLEGDASIAWIEDTTKDNALHLARMGGRPLAYAFTELGSMIFASTQQHLIEALSHFDQIKITKMADIREGESGTFIDGTMVDHTTKFPVINVYQRSYGGGSTYGVGTSSTTYRSTTTSTVGKHTPKAGTTPTTTKPPTAPPGRKIGSSPATTSPTVDKPNIWDRTKPSQGALALSTGKTIPLDGDPFEFDDAQDEAWAAAVADFYDDPEPSPDLPDISPEGALRGWEKMVWFLYFDGLLDAPVTDPMIRAGLEFLYTFEDPQQMENIIDLVMQDNLVTADLVRDANYRLNSEANAEWARKEGIIDSDANGVPDWTPGVNDA